MVFERFAFWYIESAMQTANQTPQNESEFQLDVPLFGLCLIVCCFVVALAYFLFGVLVADDIQWDYLRPVSVGFDSSEPIILDAFEDATLSTFPIFLIGFIIALPFASKLERFARQ